MLPHANPRVLAGKGMSILAFLAFLAKLPPRLRDDLLLGQFGISKAMKRRALNVRLERSAASACGCKAGLDPRDRP